MQNKKQLVVKKLREKFIIDLLLSYFLFVADVNHLLIVYIDKFEI